MIAPVYIAQADSSLSDQNVLLNQIQQAQNNVSGTGSSPFSSSNKPVLKLVNFLKTKFFGKTLPLSDKEHKLTGIGIVIGISRSTENVICLMHDVDRPLTYNAKVVFEKELFGETFGDVAQRNSKLTQQNLDIEAGLSRDISPLLNSGGELSTIASPTAPQQSQETLQNMQTEDITYFDRRTQSTQKGKIILLKGKPFFQDDGSPVFIRLEKQ